MTAILKGPDIQKFIKGVAAEATNIRIAAPFWGAKAIELLGLRQAKNSNKSLFRLICNLESGACNPVPIRSLQTLKWEMRTNKRLHAKVYIFPDCAIVGSANPSANGLALEDTEINSWHEVCCVISNREDRAKLLQWFDSLYADKGSRPVTSAELLLAENQWAKRRKDTSDIIKMGSADEAGPSLKKLAEGDQGMSVQENTWLWIYDDPSSSKESEDYNSDLRKNACRTFA